MPFVSMSEDEIAERLKKYDDKTLNRICSLAARESTIRKFLRTPASQAISCGAMAEELFSDVSFHYCHQSLNQSQSLHERLGPQGETVQRVQLRALD